MGHGEAGGNSEATSVTAEKTLCSQKQAWTSPRLVAGKTGGPTPLLWVPRPFPKITHREERAQYLITGLQWTWLCPCPVHTGTWAKHVSVRTEAHVGLRWGCLSRPTFPPSLHAPPPLSVSAQRSPPLAPKYQVATPPCSHPLTHSPSLFGATMKPACQVGTGSAPITGRQPAWPFTGRRQ